MKSLKQQLRLNILSQGYRRKAAREMEGGLPESACSGMP